MRGFNLTAALIITGFTFQRGDLAISKFNAIAGDCVLQRFQALFEVLKIVA